MRNLIPFHDVFRSWAMGASVSGFDILSLYSDGQDGIVIAAADVARTAPGGDPITTASHYRFDGSPVTADGQECGLILDMSRGGLFNPGVDRVSTWPDRHAAWIEAGGGGWSISAAAEPSDLSHAGMTELGRYYLWDYTITGDALEVYRSELSPVTRSAGSHREIVQATLPGSTFFRAAPGVSATVTASVREIPGNHLRQPGGTTLCPVYRTDGTDHWYEFDGGDYLISAAYPVPHSAGVLAAAFRPETYRGFVLNGLDTANNASLYWRDGLETLRILNGSGGVTGPGYGEGQDHWVIGQIAPGGTATLTGSGGVVSGTTGNDPIEGVAVGASSAGATPFTGRIRAAVTREAPLSAKEATDLAAWLQAPTAMTWSGP